MNEFAKKAIFALAVFFGMVDPREPPQPDFRLRRGDDAIYANVDIPAFPGKELEELCKSGNRLRVRCVIVVNNFLLTEYRDIRFDHGSYTVYISERRSSHVTSDPGAAFLLASRFETLPMGNPRSLGFPLAGNATITLELPENPDTDPMMFWGYKSAVFKIAFKTFEDIPL